MPMQRESPDDPAWPSLSKQQKKDVCNEKDSDPTIIPRDILLAGRAIALLHQQSESLDPCRLKSQKVTTPSATPIATPLTTPAASPALPPAPPPGLELPPGLEDMSSCRPRACTEPIPETVPAETTEPENFKVLMSNLPEAMMNECMMRVMLEQARLHDVESFAFRQSGKCLVTFSSYMSAYRCIQHVQGRKWANSMEPVKALYVRTVKRSQTGSDTERAGSTRKMSADAQTFVPSTKPLSAAAPEFVMPAAEKAITRDRIWSSASTDVGESSADEVEHNFQSESAAAWVACT